MNQLQSRPTGVSGLSPDAFSSMFQAIGGLRNVRAAIAMLGCLFAGILLAGLLVALLGRGGAFGYVLAALVLFVAYSTGVSASGILLLDQARGLPLRSLSDALVYGLICLPKLIALTLLAGVVGLLVFLALALLLFVCKIPGLGAVLFTLVYPLSVVVSGVILCWLLLGQSLACVAIWDGAGVMRAVAQSMAIARTRLVESMLLMAVVLLLSAIVGVLVSIVLGAGFLPTTAMSVGILGNFGGGGDITSVLTNLGSSGGHAIAGAVGAGLLWAVAITLMTQVALLGLNLVYLRVTEGLDSSAAEQALTEHVNTARRRAAELSEKAREAGEHAREQARKAAASATAAAVPPAAPVVAAAPLPPAAASGRLASVCPQCQKPVTAQDVFCGECGFKMS